MKKVFDAFLCAAFALTFFSCQKEDNGPVEPGDELIPDGYTLMTLSAVGDETKTTLDGTTVKWAEGDEIKVYCADADPSDFTIKSGIGTKNGDFRGLVPSGKTPVYAVYPNSRYDSVSGTTVYVTVPDNQDGDFGKANIAVAKINAADHNMSFKNVNAFLAFTVPSGISKVVISSVGGQNLCGTLAVSCSGDPTAGAISSGGESSITVTFPNTTGGTYYVAVAPGVEHGKGIQLEWYKGSSVSGTYWLNKAITPSVNMVYDMGSVSAEGNYYVSVDGKGKKNGMDWGNSWSAAQFWSKLHPGGTDTQMDNAKLANINGATFHLEEGTYNWGSGATVAIDGDSTVSFTIMGGYAAEGGARDVANYTTTFTGDDDADGTGDHRILTLGGNMNVTFDGISFFKGKVTDENGGALKIESTGTWKFKDCTFSYNEATNSDKDTHGGAIYSEQSVDIEGCTMSYNSALYGACVAVSGSGKQAVIKGGTFRDNTAAGNGGAIQVEKGAYMAINQVGALTTNFLNNEASRYGGALDIETSVAEKPENKIKNAVFKGNHAQWGGAVEIDGAPGKTTKVIFDDCTFGGTESGEPNYVTRNEKKDADGGAIHAENDSFVNIATSSFVGNNAVNRGGAICIKGDTMFRLFKNSFNANHATTGGVAYTTTQSSKYPDLFIDECSFDANYITGTCGCTFNIAEASHFIMHNSSVRGSYASPSQTGENGSWIDLDRIQSGTSISNCSIIGDAASSALVWTCSGTWTNYFTNNIITSSSSTTGSIHSAGSTLNLSYNHIYSATSFTDVGGNVDSVLSSNIDGLDWSNTSSGASYYWSWNGTINSAAPSKTNKTDVSARVNTASSDFVNWSGSDFNKDQRGVGRGNGDWWPGAYQDN